MVWFSPVTEERLSVYVDGSHLTVRPTLSYKYMYGRYGSSQRWWRKVKVRKTRLCDPTLLTMTDVWSTNIGSTASGAELERFRKTVLISKNFSFFFCFSFSFISGDAGRAVYTNRNTRSPEQRLPKGLLWRKCQYLWQRGALCVFCLFSFSLYEGFNSNVY